MWGLFAAAVGGVGTLVGVAQMSQALAAAGTSPPALVWQGLRLSLSPTVAGLVLLGVAAIAWLALDYVRGRATGPRTDG